MRNILLVIITLISSYGFAQSLERSVLASTGNYTSTSTLRISSTFGETFVTTLAGSSFELTQGFQQATPTTGPGPGNVQELNFFDVSVYPNPTRNIVNIKANVDGDFSVSVFDLLGRNMNVDYTNTNKVGKLDVTLDLEKYSAGLYFIKIFDDSNHLKTVKVKKQ